MLASFFRKLIVQFSFFLRMVEMYPFLQDLFSPQQSIECNFKSIEPGPKQCGQETRF